MNDSGMHALEMILRQCAAARPGAWYPSVHARANGIDRDSLDPYLDQLRLGGLIHIADWVQGQGQGYALTTEGNEVLENPRLLERLLTGRLRRPEPEPAKAPNRDPLDATWNRGEAIRAALLNPSMPVVTLALLAANIIVFLYGLKLVNQEHLPIDRYINFSLNDQQIWAIRHQTGAVSASDVLQNHQWWRLLTYMFVHLGLIHLGMNMYMLYAFGPLLERMWGHWQYLVLYLVSGLAGGCTIVLVGTGAGGASGALWGLMTSMVAWILLNRRFLPPAMASRWLRSLVTLIILNAAISFLPGVSASGHFGGGAAGFVISLPLNYLKFGRPWQRALGLVGVIAVPLVCVAPVALTDREFSRFNGVYLPKIQEGARAAESAYQETAEPLLAQKATGRNSEEVQDAIKSLAQERETLKEVIHFLDRKIPFWSADVIQAHRRGKELLEAEARLLQMSEDCLNRGRECGQEDEHGLNAQLGQVQAAQKRWRELLTHSH